MKYNPPAGSQDPDAKYVTGQPGKVRGSAVPAEAVEHPQREIVEVIRQAGLEPSGDDLGQLWKALQQLFTEKVAVATKEKAGIVKPGSGLSVKRVVLPTVPDRPGHAPADRTCCRIKPSA